MRPPLVALPLLLACASLAAASPPAFSARHALPTTPLVRCPCVFSVARALPHDAPFDLLIVRPPEWRRLRGRPRPAVVAHAPAYARRNLTLPDAHYVDARRAFFYSRLVAEHAVFALVLSPSARARAPPPDAFRAQFALHHVARQRCPVVLDEHPPSRAARAAPAAPRIVGGAFASEQLLPYMAYIYNPVTRRACTGTLIADFWVLTAAHCHISYSHTVYLNSRQGLVDGDEYLVTFFKNHELYVDTATRVKYDIALIRLDRPARNARFMRVNVNATIPLSSSVARVVGFGAIVFNASEPAATLGRLRQVDVPIVSHATCRRAYGPASFLDAEYQVCAGYMGWGGCDSCQGDSGGPMIQYDDAGEPVLVGVVSRGHRCGEPTHPGIYVRTAPFEDWLDFSLRYEKATQTRAVFSTFVPPPESNPLVKIAIGVGAGVAGLIVVAGTVLWVTKFWRRPEESGGVEGHWQTHGTTGLEPQTAPSDMSAPGGLRPGVFSPSADGGVAYGPATGWPPQGSMVDRPQPYYSAAVNGSSAPYSPPYGASSVPAYQSQSVQPVWENTEGGAQQTATYSGPSIEPLRSSTEGLARAPASPPAAALVPPVRAGAHENTSWEKQSLETESMQPEEAPAPLQTQPLQPGKMQPSPPAAPGAADGEAATMIDAGTPNLQTAEQSTSAHSGMQNDKVAEQEVCTADDELGSSAVAYPLRRLGARTAEIADESNDCAAAAKPHQHGQAILDQVTTQGELDHGETDGPS